MYSTSILFLFNRNSISRSWYFLGLLLVLLYSYVLNYAARGDGAALLGESGAHSSQGDGDGRRRVGGLVAREHRHVDHSVRAVRHRVRGLRTRTAHRSSLRRAGGPTRQQQHAAHSVQVLEYHLQYTHFRIMYMFYVLSKQYITLRLQYTRTRTCSLYSYFQYITLILH